MVQTVVVQEIISLAKRRNQAYKAINKEEEGCLLLEEASPENDKYEQRQKTLYTRICSLTVSEVLDIISIMYLGRDCHEYNTPSDLPDDFTEDDYKSEYGIVVRTGKYYFDSLQKYLPSTFGDKEIAASQIVQKVPLDEYLQQGLYLLSCSSVVG